MSEGGGGHDHDSAMGTIALALIKQIGCDFSLAFTARMVRSEDGKVGAQIAWSASTSKKARVQFVDLCLAKIVEDVLPKIDSRKIERAREVAIDRLIKESQQDGNQ